MFSRPTQYAPRHIVSSLRTQCLRQRRYAASIPPPTPPTASQTRVDRINRRLPRFLHKYTSGLARAPISHITSFLILHELTAVIPLFGLTAYFHYTHWLPPWFAEGTLVLAGVEKFGAYFRRKGWIRTEDAVEARREAAAHAEEEEADSRSWLQRMRGQEKPEKIEAVGLRKVDKAWNVGEGGVRLVIEIATAWAVTKALLPLRIPLSIWATPWFARTAVLPITARFKKLFTKKKGNAAGTGAVEGGVVPKNGSGGGS